MAGRSDGRLIGYISWRDQLASLVRAEAASQGITESALVHCIVAQHYGLSDDLWMPRPVGRPALVGDASDQEK